MAETPRKLKQDDLLVMIDDLARGSNVTLEDIRDHHAFLLGWLPRPSREEVRDLLARMISADLVNHDGSGHKGERFSLTYDGKQEVRELKDPSGS